LVINATTGANAVGMKLTNTGGNFYIGKDNSASGRMVTGGTAYNSYVWNEDNHDLVFGTNNTKRLTISAAGSVTALDIYSRATSARVVYVDASGLLGTLTSSLRYKTDVVPLEIDTKKLYQLRPISYTRIENGRREFGLAAEEVNDYIPQIVAMDSLRKPDYVSYERLPVLLLNELQRHEARLNTIDTEIASVKGNR
jgi:hypothetical protein